MVKTLNLSNQDAFSRHIDYLRIAITDRCNLRCIYCMPEEGVRPCSHDEILRYEEIATVVSAAADLGIHRIRLTGGEPLVRLGVVELVRSLATIPGIDDLSMTTNGMLLAEAAEPLADAGLQRVNVSLDTLRKDRFREITRWGHLDDVLAGIAAAHRAGLTPVKINSVVIRGVNDDEVVDLARKTVSDGWDVRFIEWMPVGEPQRLIEEALRPDDRSEQGMSWHSRVVTAAEVRSRVEAALGELTPVEGPRGAGPARSYRLPGSAGTLGFITPVSEHFCQTCNRLRLTADGRLRPCLLADDEIDLRDRMHTAAQNGAPVKETVKAILLEAIRAKPRRHHLGENTVAEDRGVGHRAMAQIGG